MSLACLIMGYLMELNWLGYKSVLFDSDGTGLQIPSHLGLLRTAIAAEAGNGQGSETVTN